MRKIKESKKKIVLKLVFRLRNTEELSKIEAGFKKSGYIIEEFGEIDKRNFIIEEVERKIKVIREKYGLKSKIVLLSNIKDVCFVAFRIYNKEIDNCIFFIDKINYSILNNGERNYEEISEFIGIENDRISGKIYTNINLENFTPIFDFFVKNNNFAYFENLEKFDFKTDIKNEEIIDNIDNKDKLIEENLLFEKLYKSNYFVIFYILGLLRKNGVIETRDITTKLFKYFQSKNILEKQKIASSIYRAKGIDKIEFKEKMALYSLIVLLELPFNYLLKLLINTILEDKEGNEKYYTAIFSDLIYFTAHNRLLGYDGADNDYKAVMNKIENYYKEKNDIYNKNEYIGNSKKIVFMVDSLVNVNYSVEKVTFDMAKNIKKYYPEYEIIIFVEDNFNYTSEEKILLHSFIGDAGYGSDFYSEEHNKEIEGTGVKILYSLPVTNKEYRVKDMIHAIFDYNPEVIITTSLCSYSINLLYEYFPTMYITMGDINSLNNFDVELYPIENVKKQLEIRGKKLEENMYDFKYGADFIESEKEYQREEYNIEKNDFVMVSVGVRLRTEITEEYLELVYEILNKYKEAKWFLIGETKFPLIEQKYKEFIGKQIFFIEYENNLGAFYKMCDIFLNPVRDGGGFSIAQAIANNVPVVSYKGRAACYHAGEENCVNSREEYVEEVYRIYSDKAYVIKKVESEKKNFEKYNSSAVTEDLINYINLAKMKYLNRKNKENKNVRKIF